MVHVSTLLSFLFVPLATSLSTTTTTTMTATRSMASAKGSPHSTMGRVELFFKGPVELQDRVRFLRSCGVTSFNLVNKDKRDDVQGWVDSIREVYPEADICAHYSLKHNKVARKGVKDHGQLLLRFLENSSADEILLVSGSGEKKAWNTLEALRVVGRAAKVEDEDGSGSDSTGKGHHPKIAVAYNPYFPSDSDQEKEDRRLTEKLATGCVSKVYLQFGTDMDCLQKGLKLIRKQSGDFEIDIAGSLFLPTKKLIAQQKFRPWNGVFLSEEFLKGPEEATAVISEIIKVYRTNNVEMLWEAPGIRNEKDMKIAEELLSTGVNHEVIPLLEKQNRSPSTTENNKAIINKRMKTTKRY